MSFPVNFTDFLRTPIVKEQLWWLLLNIMSVKPKLCSEAADWKCSVKKMFFKIRKFHRKTSVPEPVLK